MKHSIHILIFSFLFLVSCSKDDNEPASPHSKIKIAEAVTASGISVSLLADQTDLSVAYNKIYVGLKNKAGAEIKNATVTYTPIMDMHTMQHSSPVEQPAYSNTTELYEGAVVFSMPSGDMGSWQLKVTVNNEPVTFDVSIKQAAANTKYTATFKGSDNQSYTVSLIQPATPKIGLNDLELLISKRQDMMNFPPEEELTVELSPEMPSMGHGSPNNVNPVHTGRGHYTGKVNFTMTGDWRLHLKLIKGNTVIVEDAALDLMF